MQNNEGMNIKRSIASTFQGSFDGNKVIEESDAASIHKSHYRYTVLSVFVCMCYCIVVHMHSVYVCACATYVYMSSRTRKNAKADNSNSLSLSSWEPTGVVFRIAKPAVTPIGTLHYIVGRKLPNSCSLKCLRK